MCGASKLKAIVHERHTKLHKPGPGGACPEDKPDVGQGRSVVLSNSEGKRLATGREATVALALALALALVLALTKPSAVKAFSQPFLHSCVLQVADTDSQSACFKRDCIRVNPQEYDCSAWKNAWIRR